MTDFPFVPIAPGVPPVAIQPGSIFPAIIQLFADSALLALGGAPQWGFIDSTGGQTVVADSVIEIDYDEASRISDYPIQGGITTSFESYNKVDVPFQTRVTLAKGGSIGDRTAFLQGIQSARQSLDLFTIVTPEATYINANIVRYNYRRSAQQGVTLILVDVYFEEVRVQAGSSFGNTSAPSGADQSNAGSVQPQDPGSAGISDNFDSLT